MGVKAADEAPPESDRFAPRRIRATLLCCSATRQAEAEFLDA